jgi:hypothetical protein
MLFLEIMPMLVEDTNRYCCQYLGTLDGHCPLPEVTIQGKYWPLSHVLQLGQNRSNAVKITG